MEFAPRLANHGNQSAWDCEMNILGRDIELEASGCDFGLDLLESFDNRAQLSCLYQADLREHLRVCDRAADIVTVEPSIEGQRRGEGLDLGQASIRKASADQTRRLATLGRITQITFSAPTRFHCDGNEANRLMRSRTRLACISWPAAIGTRIPAPRNSSNRRDGGCGRPSFDG